MCLLYNISVKHQSIYETFIEFKLENDTEVYGHYKMP